MPYPQYLYQDFGALGEYLLQPPSPSELDENGCFSKDACKAIEAMLQQDIASRIKSFTMSPDWPRGTDPSNKWRTVSCLQKAIRFGDAEMAAYAASAAYDMDRKYLLRRLGICAIEDVGAGGLYGLCATLAASGSQAFREQFDERRMACFLADLLARSAKDRTACELLVIVDFERKIDKVAMGKMTQEDLAIIVRSDQPLDVRMCAAWMMAGTKKFWGESMPKENDRPPTALFQLMVATGMCRATLYAAAKIASRLIEGMFVGLLFMDQWLRATPVMEIEQPDLPPIMYERVGKLLGAAYDMHTREGRTAIGKFRKENHAMLAPYLKHCEPELQETLMWFGVFVAEGGQLSRKAVYANAKELRRAARQVELAFPGLPEELHDDFIELLQANIQKLNECRGKVLWAKQKK